jgi:hypothetical protein
MSRAHVKLNRLQDRACDAHFGDHQQGGDERPSAAAKESSEPSCLTGLNRAIRHICVESELSAVSDFVILATRSLIGHSDGGRNGDAPKLLCWKVV